MQHSRYSVLAASQETNAVKGSSSEPCEHHKKTSATHASNPAGAAPTTSMEGRQVKRLFPSEMEERCRLVMCYNCNEKFGHGHNKVCLAWPTSCGGKQYMRRDAARSVPRAM